jgi:N6-L-threonylcarbamoyladenine synthase
LINYHRKAIQILLNSQSQFHQKRTSGYEFSFSGLKTAVLYYLKRINFQNLSEDEKRKFIPNICAQFSKKQLLTDSLSKLSKQLWDFNIKSISVVGGVAANSELRKRMIEKANELGFKLYIPDLTFCTDNAGMIAYAGYVKLKAGIKSDLEISPIPNLKI